MASYRDKLQADLDRWIEAGFVQPDQREAILATVPASRQITAAGALGFVAAGLLGAAIIAFVAANWNGMSRILRFVLVLTAFAAACGGGAYISHRGLQHGANALLALAALIFAAAIGLTGQIFDIAGDPKAALYGASVMAGALALAGRSVGAGVLALAFCGIADFTDIGLSEPGSDRLDLAFLASASAFGLFGAQRWKSATLAHASSVGIGVGLFWFAFRIDDPAPALYGIAALFSILAFAARTRRALWAPSAAIAYGWFAACALLAFAAAGLYQSGPVLTLLHRAAWLAASIGLIAMGRKDAHTGVTAVGVVGGLAAVSALMLDLGLDLMLAALVFAALATAALIGMIVLNRRAKP
jgi:uncharacterized membrane protein